MVKVSVIIPAFNSMAFLAKALDSVFRQTFSDFEVIVVDDGSTDGTASYLNSLDYQNVRLISQSNQGVSAARNTGIQAARGEYLAFLDADDVWEASKLEKQVNFLDNHQDIGIVGAKITLIDSEGQLIRKLDIPHNQRITMEDLLKYDCLLCGSTPLVRRVCFEHAGLFDTELSFAEDWEMWIRISLRNQIFVLQEHLVYYRQHNSSASKNAHKMALSAEKALLKVRPLLSLSQHKIFREACSDYILKSSWIMLSQSEYYRSILVAFKAAKTNPKIALSKSFLRLNTIAFLKGCMSQVRTRHDTPKSAN